MNMTQVQISKSYTNHIRSTNLRNEHTRQLRVETSRKTYLEIQKPSPKAFWRYCNSKLKNKPRLGELADDDGNQLKDVMYKADILNKYFASVYTRESLIDQPSLEVKYEGQPLTIPDVSIDTINKKLHRLNVQRSRRYPLPNPQGGGYGHHRQSTVDNSQ